MTTQTAIEDAARLLADRFGGRRLQSFTDDEGRAVEHVSVPVLAALRVADADGWPVMVERTHGADTDDLGVMLADLGDVVRVSVHRVSASALDAQGLEDVTDALEDVSSLHHGAHGLMSALDVAPAALCEVLGPWIEAEIATQDRMSREGIRR